MILREHVTVCLSLLIVLRFSIFLDWIDFNIFIYLLSYDKIVCIFTWNEKREVEFAYKEKESGTLHYHHFNLITSAILSKILYLVYLSNIAVDNVQNIE